MISAVYLINLKGEILIYRAYRDDVSRAAADAFRMQVYCCCCCLLCAVSVHCYSAN